MIFQKEQSKKEKQSKQEKGDTQTTQDRMDAISSPSTSFYAVRSFVLFSNSFDLLYLISVHLPLFSEFGASAKVYLWCARSLSYQYRAR